MPKPHQIQLVESAFREKVAWTAEELAGQMECHERTVRRCTYHLRDQE